MSKPDKLMDAALKLETLLPRTMTTLFRSADDDILRNRPVGQIRMLRTLYSGDKPAAELGEMLHLSPSSLTQMSNRLIALGLVKKRSVANDRRARVLGLTKHGREVMDIRRNVRAKSALRLLESMSSAEVDSLIELLEGILKNSPLEAVTAEAVT